MHPLVKYTYKYNGDEILSDRAFLKIITAVFSQGLF
jgi:hypothetical protein